MVTLDVDMNAPDWWQRFKLRLLTKQNRSKIKSLPCPLHLYTGQPICQPFLKMPESVDVTPHLLQEVWWNHIQLLQQQFSSHRWMPWWIWKHIQTSKMFLVYWPSGFAMKLSTRLMKFPNFFTNSLLSLACKSVQVNCVSDAWKLEKLI